LRRLFNQQRNKARRAHIEAGLAEVAAGGGDNAPAAQGALAAAAAAGQAEAAPGAGGDDDTAPAPPGPEAASPPALSTPSPAPTAQDGSGLTPLPIPSAFAAFLQAGATPAQRPLISQPAPALPPAPQSTAECPPPCVDASLPNDFALHPVAVAAFEARLAGHIAQKYPNAAAKNAKGKVVAAEKKRKAADKAEQAVASEARKREKKQAGDSTSASSHAAKEKAASAEAAKELATSMVALAKEDAANRKHALKAVCAFLIFGDVVLCSIVTWTLYYAPCSH
jgi:hypothetical protein